jgi:hypothetical protein
MPPALTEIKQLPSGGSAEWVKQRGQGESRVEEKSKMFKNNSLKLSKSNLSNGIAT